MNKPAKNNYSGFLHARGEQKPKNICQLFLNGEYGALLERIIELGKKMPLIHQTIRSKEKSPSVQRQKIEQLDSLYNNAVSLAESLCKNATGCNKNQARRLFAELQSIMA